MNRFFRPVVILATCCPLLCSSPVSAEGSSMARLSALRFSTLDLTPDDGVAAGYVITSMDPTHVEGSYSVNGNVEAEYFFLDPYQPGMARIDHGPSFGEGSTSGAIGDLFTRNHAGQNLGEHGHVAGHGIQHVMLTLLPNTALLLSGHADSRAEAYTDTKEYASLGIVEITLTSQSGDPATFWQSSAAFIGEGEFEEQHEDFTLRYDNGGAGNMAVALDMHIQAYVLANAPIPEPATWAMLSAGLLMLGATGWYRRRT